jgi:uncharacterized protein (TIGR02452 family)
MRTQNSKPFNFLEHESNFSNRIAKETIQIMKSKFCTNSKNEKKSIEKALNDSIDQCTDFQPKFKYNIKEEAKNGQGFIDVVAEDVISCSYRLMVIENHENYVILNFANGIHPGGRWGSYARAQEECIMRASGAYASIITKGKFYEFNSHDKIISSDYIIYSPDVPFFRNSQNEFLDEPFNISIITCAAVIATSSSLSSKQISNIMEPRCRQIIQCAIHNNKKVIALGAFGCGAFGNDPNVIAEIFRKILIDEGYQFYFDYIVFPIPEFHGSKRSTNIHPFAKILGVEIKKYK